MTAAVDSYNAHNRPIRPLPKRRLRSRLSEDTRATLFAPAPTNPTRLFQLPYGPFGDPLFLGHSAPRASLEVSTGVHTDHIDSLQDESDDEDNSHASVAGNNGGSVTGSVSNGGTPGGAGTGTAQMDSYDWVENTNNKKKRKIPSPANPSAALGNVNGTGSTSIGSQSAGFSPTGSGATPRSRWKSSGAIQRSPLSISSANIRRTPRRYPVSPLEARRPGIRLFPQTGSEDTQSTSSSQNENNAVLSDKSGISPIHQSQFTFEHMTPASTSLARQATFPSSVREYPKTMSTVGTQTSPSMSATNVYPPTPTPSKKKISRGTKQLQQQRQRRAGIGAYGITPNPNGEIWICEFCEYEAIFGEKPEALMRQYDIKERRERRRLREKQRLLDKAKQKSKKNQSKSAKKSSAAHPQHAAPSSSPPPTDIPNDQPPLPTTSIQTQKNRRNSQQVQTDFELHNSSHHVSAGRGAGGSGGVGGGGGKTATTGTLAGGELQVRVGYQPNYTAAKPPLHRQCN
ncbi:hypothetical protein BDZ91DRAFT_293088 [Kalaharituber pfeilii]|nr:hypothetical protein BDZ91DRAFT_293088 [Kalaharituber pfeilii]